MEKLYNEVLVSRETQGWFSSDSISWVKTAGQVIACYARQHHLHLHERCVEIVHCSVCPLSILMPDVKIASIGTVTVIAVAKVKLAFICPRTTEDSNFVCCLVPLPASLRQQRSFVHSLVCVGLSATVLSALTAPIQIEVSPITRFSFPPILCIRLHALRKLS